MSDTDAIYEGAIVDETPASSFAMEIAKTTVVNAAATAGTLAAFVVVGLTSSKVKEFRRNRAAKKAAAAQTTPSEA